MTIGNPTWFELIGQFVSLGKHWRSRKSNYVYESAYLEAFDHLYHKTHLPFLQWACDEYDFNQLDAETQTAILIRRGVYTLDEVKANNAQILKEI